MLKITTDDLENYVLLECSICGIDIDEEDADLCGNCRVALYGDYQEEDDYPETLAC